MSAFIDQKTRARPGRPVEYNTEWDLKALMLRQLLQIPYVKDLVKRLRRDHCLREVCGYRDRESARTVERGRSELNSREESQAKL